MFSYKTFFLTLLSFLPGAAGVLLLIFAPEIAAFAGGKSWDAPVYYQDQLLFLGRTGIAFSFCFGGALMLYRKGWGIWELLFTGALIMGAFLQIDSYVRREFWHDTMALALYLQQTSWRDLFIPGAANPLCQAAPPGFILLSKAAGTCFGFSRWILNLLPLLFGLGAIGAFVLVIRKHLPLPGRVAALWLFVLNPGLWFYAGEFKQYTADIFFTVTVLWAALEFASDPEKRWGKLLVTGSCGLFFSHAMLFVLPAAGAALWIDSGFSFDKRLWKLLILWAAEVLLMAGYARMMMPEAMYVHEHHAAGFAPVPDSQENLKWYFNTFKNLFAAPWNMVWKIEAFVVFPLIGMFCGICQARGKKRILPITGGLILLMLFTASLLHLYPLASGSPFAKGRLILFTIPPAILIFGMGISSKKALIWCVPVFLGALLNVCTSFMPFGGFGPAVRELVRRTSPGEKVIVNSVTAHIALLYYGGTEHFRNVQILNAEELKTALPDRGRFHIFLVDIPPGKYPIPENYTILYRKGSVFSTLFHLEKKKLPGKTGSGKE